MLVPVVVVDVGLKVAVTPLGMPLAVKDTALAKPPERVIVIVLVPLAARLMSRLDGLRESAKSGLAVPDGSPTIMPRPFVLT